MVDFPSRQRSGLQSRALHYSYEKAGLILDNQPIPWNADAVMVEAQLRSANPRRPQPATAAEYLRQDFALSISGVKEVVPAESLKQEGLDFWRVFFRFAVPTHKASVEIRWRGTSLGQSLGQLQLPVLQAEEFLQHLALQMPMVSVQLEEETVQCQAAVTTQCHSIVLSAVVTSATSLVPILDLGLRARMLSEKGDVIRDEPIHLSHTQLKARQALLTVVMPRPRKTGDWLFQWVLDGKVLAEQQLRTLVAAGLYRSLRVSATRFVLQHAHGRLVVVRTLPSTFDGVERIGPCFWVASSMPGLAGWCDLELRARPNQQGPAAEVPLSRQRILISDGPTPVLAGTLDLADFRQIKHFELRCRNRLVGLLPVEDVPSSSFTSEGGFVPPEHFPWSHAAESQLQEKLNRLLEGK
jgi:hypothetical protein